VSAALAVLSQAGLRVTVKPDGVSIGVLPAEKITADLRQFIIKHKAEILAEIQAANTPQSGVIRYQLNNGSAGTVIDSEGVQSAVNTLVQHYVGKLDIPALIDPLLLMGDAAQAEANKLIQRIAKT
jgi:hypothetical protein